MADDHHSSETMPKIITFLSSLLQRVSESNDMVANNNDHHQLIYPNKISVFHGLSRPSISIQGYLERIFKYANCSPSCFVVAYVYLDRFAQRHPSFPIDSFNVHRLLITSILVSVKFMDDTYYNNAYYAKIGGITTSEMNVLEVDFLFSLGFQLNVTPTNFHDYCSYLQREMTFESSLQLAEPPLNKHSGRPLLKGHSCFNEDESTNHRRLAV